MTGLFGPLWEGRKDLVLVACMIGILVALFTPIPPALLDVLLIANLALGLMILLLTFYTQKPLSFSTFPSLLLMATLFRLALNVSATRLILDHADAGQVIKAVGTYVVGGNYVIGLVVFLILVVVQYVVVTNGAQRVAEVAARFTLDSMPGKQMSIDADMNMGLIDEVEAKRRRAHIEREASFYGAMDGATKFVKGDAIAGIIIILINIVGGLAIGIAQHGMSWGQALQTYTLLTVGDGIVTQIPSLIVATATGIIITRAATDERLGEEVARQVTAQPRTLLILAVALLGILLLPGIPVLPVAIVFGFVAITGWFAIQKHDEDGDAAATAEAVTSKAEVSKVDDKALLGSLRIEPLEVRLGPALSTGFHAGPELTERLQNLRRQLALELGIVVPMPKLVPDPRVAGDHYAVAVHNAIVGNGRLRPGLHLAINAGGKRATLEGEATTEPTYGLAAIWIEPDARSHARASGYTVADCDTVLLTHLGELLRRHAADLVTRSEAERLVGRIRESNAALVDELVPGILSYTDVQKVFQALLRERVSIRHVEAILEVLVDQGRTVKVADELAERVRERLGPTICQALADPRGEVNVLTLAPEFERALMLGRQQNGGAPLIDPAKFDQLIADLARNAEQMMAKSLLPVLLCAPSLRRPIARLLTRSLPHVVVVGLNEVPPATRVRSFAMVGAPAAAAA